MIAAAQRHDIYIPRFCYHERMNPVGMCRMCLVDIDTGRGPMLQPSCMVTVAPDMKVETESPAAKRAQEGVIELLLANHPLDCPVCDKGGECPLQDQAFSHGPGESRFVEEKRHFEKPIPISDLVLLDRERCILCDRCTRFADEVAGDALIHFVQRGNDTQVMTFPDEPFSSYFSGNTVQICPVGALTASPYRFRARPWDLAESETTCTTCSVGCRMTTQSSRDHLVRHLGVDNEVTWGWLCDRGRFNFEAVNSAERLANPLVRGESGLAETSWATALAAVAKTLRSTIDSGRAKRVAVLGGARGTNEDAFAWARLADALGVEHRDAQLGDGLPAEVLDLPRATIEGAATAPTVILLGPDLKEELPVLFLRLRDSAVRKRTRLIEVAPAATGLTALAWRSVRLESAAATMADPTGRRPVAQRTGGDRGRTHQPRRVGWSGGCDGCGAVYDAVVAVQPDVTVLPALRRGNVVGALQLGLRPRPGGLDAGGILAAAAAGEIDVLFLVGADPLADFPDTALAEQAIDRAGVVVALDSFPTASANAADVVLPAAMFGEKDGTTTNLEGRVTTVARRVTPAGTSRDRLDGRRRARRSARPRRGGRRVARRLRRSRRRSPPPCRRTPGRLARRCTAIATACSPSTRRPPPRRRSMAALPASATATTTGSCSPGASTTRRRRRRCRPRSPDWLGDADAHVNPVDADKIGAPDDGMVQLIGARGSVTMTLRRDHLCAAPCSCRSTGLGRHDARRRHRPRHRRPHRSACKHERDNRDLGGQTPEPPACWPGRLRRSASVVDFGPGRQAGCLSSAERRERAQRANE